MVRQQQQHRQEHQFQLGVGDTVPVGRLLDSYQPYSSYAHSRQRPELLTPGQTHATALSWVAGPDVKLANVPPASDNVKPRYICCGRKFKYANLLTYHKRWECGKSFQCMYCHQKFSGKRTYVQHAPMRCRDALLTGGRKADACTAPLTTVDLTADTLAGGDALAADGMRTISLRPRPRRGKNFDHQLKARPV